MEKAIVLLSGGLDSTVTAYYAHQHGYAIKALTLNYGQLHTIEIEKARSTAQMLDIEHHVLSLSLPWKGSSLLDSSIPVPEKREETAQDIPSTYVPARNTIFLSYALSWAEVAQAGSVFIGANVIDYSGYPDCRPEYFDAFQKLYVLGTKRGVEGHSITIKTPLLQMDKKQIVLLGKQCHVPFEHTWSCYKGGQTPCRVCDACILRKKGFDEAGVMDPLLHV